MTLADVMVRQRDSLMIVAMVMMFSMVIIVAIMGVMGLQEINGRYPDKKVVRKVKDINPIQISDSKFDDVYTFLDNNFNEIMAFGDDLIKFKAPAISEQGAKRGVVYESFKRASSAIDTRLSSLSNRLVDLGLVPSDRAGSKLSRQVLVKDFSEKYRSLYKV